MNELQAILSAFDSSQKSNETAFLATVVKTQGSTYRRPGAKMLMTNTGKMVGTISGGCLENDVFQHTRQRVSGEPIVVTYDNTAPDDIIWGFGLGCNGVVQVLIEPLERENTPNIIAFIQECLNRKHDGIIATVFASEDAVNVKIGSRLLFYANDNFTTDIKDTNLTESLIADCQTALINQKSTVNKYQLAWGSAEVFIEVIQPPTPLVIFGAGRDAVPVAKYAKTLGWHVTVVDCRADEATRDRFLMADEIILTRRDAINKQVYVDERTATVVMTHNYLDDREILKMLLSSSTPYLGVLGSKQRTERLLRDLDEQQVIYTKVLLEKLYAPIGLDIGADTPEEIAIAIIAEIQAVLAKRFGGMLKDRNGSIHQQNHLEKRLQIISSPG
jgi:xanthine dehydrogenase accessory factor